MCAFAKASAKERILKYVTECESAGKRAKKSNRQVYGESSSGKTQGFGPCIRGFESYLPSHFYFSYIALISSRRRARF